MMTNSVIEVSRLSKRYRRGLKDSSQTLRDALVRFVCSPLDSLRPALQEPFWALQDVSLDVREGEVLGLIGRNGAGKTTLLKILSRVTRPTSGYAEIRGRVRSLLEVGTGFHAELTGRENTYLSGSILGMSNREIERKFDEIMAFADIDKFIDTPVKHYSSGMYVRLAFAVAAHLEPEILLVDEVLAVGDVNFQKKCLGRMGEVARGGRTVVLVSHQLNQIRRLCNRVVWVDGGRVRMAGPAHEVVSAYERGMAAGDSLIGESERRPTTKGRFLRWAIVRPGNEGTHIVDNLHPVTIKFEIEISRPLRNGIHGVALYNHDRQLIWARSQENLTLEPGIHELSYTFPMLPLRPGSYNWIVSMFDDGNAVDFWDCLPEMIIATEIHQHPDDQWNGILNIPGHFEVGKRG
jgi:lipopolysaccharide transport system ATP-binding protein